VTSGFEHILQDAFGWTGSWNESGAWYGWWSGAAGEVGFLAAFAVAYRKIECHSSGCHRIGHHKLEGSPYTVCSKCHPQVDKRPDRKGMHELHRKLQGWNYD
jgi:hypothetical protein